MFESLPVPSDYWIYEKRRDSCVIELQDVKVDPRKLRKLQCNVSAIRRHAVGCSFNYFKFIC